MKTTANFAKKVLALRFGDHVTFDFEGHEITVSLQLCLDGRNAFSDFWMSCDGNVIRWEEHPFSDLVFDVLHNGSCKHFGEVLVDIFRDHIAQAGQKAQMDSEVA